VQRLYIEGLEAEFGGHGPTTSTEADSVVFSHRRGEMARLGLTEINLS
jgi:hypothetical protein